jgi:hypothetical protein
MIEWIEATEESLKDVKENVFVIFLYRDSYIVDVAFPFEYQATGKTMFVKRDGYVIAKVKYWAKINIPSEIEEFHAESLEMKT